MVEGKRICVIVPDNLYLHKLLACCKKCGLNEEKMIALTNDPSIPRNIKGIRSNHPKHIEVDKLRSNYEMFKAELKQTVQSDSKKIEELKRRYNNLQDQIFNTESQMQKEILNNAGVLFCPRQHIDEIVITHFRPELQIIVNTKFIHNANVWKMILQAPRTILFGNPSQSECLSLYESENKKPIQYMAEEFHGAEGVCFPLLTRYSTNAEIANCANNLLPYAYADNIKINEAGAHRRVIDCLSPANQEKIEKIGIGFSRNLFKKLIAAPMVYIDKDLV